MKIRILVWLAESQFLFDRSRQQNLSSYFGEEGVIQEEDEEEHKSESDGLKDSSNFVKPQLGPEEEGNKTTWSAVSRSCLRTFVCSL